MSASLFDHSQAGFSFCNFPVLPSPLLLPPLAQGGVNAGGRWLGYLPSQRDTLGFTPPPLLLLLPGGQKGGLKSNWRLAGEEPTRGASRVALSDNCK